MARRWTYLVIDLPGTSDEEVDELNHYGDAGFDLVAVADRRAYLKRETTDADDTGKTHEDRAIELLEQIAENTTPTH
jgi:hypothetical protein